MKRARTWGPAAPQNLRVLNAEIKEQLEVERYAYYRVLAASAHKPHATLGHYSFARARQLQLAKIMLGG